MQRRLHPRYDERMEFDPTTQEGKIIVAMMDLLEEMADVVSEHDDALDQAFDELGRH